MSYLHSWTPVAASASSTQACWPLRGQVQRTRSKVPTESSQAWTAAPVRIFAGGKDDYDERDPNACQEAIDSLPELGRRSFSVKVYASATHGWDQRRAATFYERLACKGRGCYDSNLPDAE